MAEAEAGGEAGGAAGGPPALAASGGGGAAGAAHAGPDVQRERGQALQVHGAAVLPLLSPAQEDRRTSLVTPRVFCKVLGLGVFHGCVTDSDCCALRLFYRHVRRVFMYSFTVI